MCGNIIVISLSLSLSQTHWLTLHTLTRVILWMRICPGITHPFTHTSHTDTNTHYTIIHMTHTLHTHKLTLTVGNLASTRRHQATTSGLKSVTTFWSLAHSPPTSTIEVLRYWGAGVLGLIIKLPEFLRISSQHLKKKKDFWVEIVLKQKWIILVIGKAVSI